MGKLDGYLICSDLDNTLTYEGKIPEANIEAIRYFQENGGYFTICSGRNPEFLRQFTAWINLNTYVIGFGGAKAVDLHSEDVLFHTTYTERMKEIYQEMIEEASDIHNLFFHFSNESTFTTFTLEEYMEKRNEIMKRSISKAGIRFSKEADDEGQTRQLREKYKGEDVEIVRSYASCLELISAFGSKRTATHKLKEALGAHTLICVGDFENDISMVEGADIGYAVGNACEVLKAVADRITVPASEGAICAIIEDIEKSL
jgi:Cof subfamily protein (haloacid dehalogenase superfamily)